MLSCPFRAVILLLSDAVILLLSDSDSGNLNDLILICFTPARA
jgi:hypothetical protein